ncbi:MAG: hypothetical protein ABFD80_05580, partial [Acidobacteriota bacterium]
SARHAFLPVACHGAFCKGFRKNPARKRPGYRYTHSGPREFNARLSSPIIFIEKAGCFFHNTGLRKRMPALMPVAAEGVSFVA